jgi:hypothetical protein
MKDAVQLVKAEAQGNQGMERARTGLRFSQGKPNKVLLCEFCDASFTSAAGLYLHKTSMHFHRSFKCHLCGRMLKRKENLIKHLLVHEKQRKAANPP